MSWNKPPLPLRAVLTTLKGVILVAHKKYNFVYQTKNLINGKTYIGVHCTDNINDGYIGGGIRRQSSTKYSSTAISSAVKEYGYNNFKVEIMAFFDTSEEAYLEEAFLVNESWVSSKSNYNTSLGGRYSVMSEDGRSRVSQRMKLNNPMKNPEIAKAVGEIVSKKLLGMKRTPEQIEKIKRVSRDYCSKKIYDMDTNVQYDSMRKCSEAIGHSRTYIKKLLNVRFKFVE